ncbi:MAG: hypothetical protein AB2L12_13450 [Smithellaceae bacterium]
MKKTILIIFMFLICGCSGIIHHTVGKFEYIAIPQPAIENPTFSVYVKGYYQDRNAWLKEQIESALMHQKISVLTYTNSKQFVTTTSGEGKSASAQDNSGTALAKDKVDITTTSEFQSLVKSNYFIQADYDHWTFSIISMKNHEIVAKGTFTSLFVDDIRSNVKVILQEMKIIQ